MFPARGLGAWVWGDDDDRGVEVILWMSCPDGSISMCPPHLLQMSCMYILRPTTTIRGLPVVSFSVGWIRGRRCWMGA